MNLRAGGVVVLAFLSVGAFQAVTGIIPGNASTSSGLSVSGTVEVTDPGRWAEPCLGSEELHGWISEAMDIMDQHDIPGSYYGICRNIERESGGNPGIVNTSDVNARNGTPSIGLLQVIGPTFDSYWEEEFGVPHDQYDPVANIVVACNYAASRYGSIDNVNGPY